MSSTSRERRLGLCALGIVVLLGGCRGDSDPWPSGDGGTGQPDGSQQPQQETGPKPNDGSAPPPPGTVVVTEFMANPSKVDDSVGEWFEVYNPTSATVDLNGWTIKDATSSHTIKSSVAVGPGQYVVLGNNVDAKTNGGVSVVYGYGSMSLGNSGDTISLVNKAGQMVDTVSYTSSWGIASGASHSLKLPGMDNSVSSSWCVEAKPWSGSLGDRGTPGKPTSCGPPPAKDSGVPPVKDSGVPPVKDSGPPPPPGAIKAAAIQYGSGLYSAAPGCSDDNCAVSYFIKQAAQQGATYVVVPEGGLDQKYYETYPTIGVKPHQSSTWTSVMVMYKMAALADQLDITIIFNAYTAVGGKYYNTFVAVNKDGAVVGLHHKYHLFANEGNTLTAGTTCVDSFQTPAGKAGLLICADVQCIIYIEHGVSKSSCSSSGLTLINQYFAAKPAMTFFSSFWMATGKTNPYWKATTMMSDFAKHSNAYFIGANTIYNAYHGGGVFKPDGTAIQTVDQTTPGIAYGTIPKPGTPPPPPPTGSIVITEIMPNPKVAADTSGEWFELYNAGTSTVNLSGYTIKDATTNSHKISGTLNIAPGAYVVLGINGTTSSNGGVPVNYVYSNFSLSNTGDTVALYDASNALVDTVTYSTSSGWTVGDGASMALKQTTLDNSLSTSWCQESTTWTGSLGDFGSPGAATKCK